MKEVTRSITVDLLRRGSVRLIFAKQNDENSRKLHISLTADGVPYPVPRSAQVLIGYQRPDMSLGADEATVLDDGTVEAIISLWALSKVGEVKCSLSIFDGNAKLSSTDFALDVSESYYNGGDLTPQAYSLLTSHMNKMNDILSAEEARVVAEEARNVAENSRETAEAERNSFFEEKSTQIAEMINELDNVSTEFSENEALRITAEEQRITSDEARASAEAERSREETLRKQAEVARAEAEAERQSLFKKYGKADGISIVDADSHYNSNTVEGALSEVGISLNGLESTARGAQATANEAKQSIANALGIKGKITLLPSDWSDELTATVTVGGITDNDMISIFPSSLTDKNIIEEIELFASHETVEDNIIFSAKYKPSNNIVLCYFITRGKQA